MTGTSQIEWTDATWNPVTGCDRVSPGCAHCYALTLASRLKAMGQPRYQRDGDPKTSGPGFGLTLHPDKLDEPLRWTKPRMVFVNSMSDLFHEEIPEEFVYEVLAVIEQAPQHTFQVLTKRPERAHDLLWTSRVLHDGKLPANLWLGVSIENARYTWRADVLREIPAAVRFISAEPLLGSLFDCGGVQARRKRADVATESGLGATADRPDSGFESSPSPRAPLDLTGIDWLIVGGESGGRFARPMHPEWARELRDACLDLGEPTMRQVPGGVDVMENDRPACFFKQWGSWAPADLSLGTPDGVLLSRSGRTWRVGENEVRGIDKAEQVARMRYVGPSPKSGGRLLDGREWNEMPPTREGVPA